MNLFRGQKVKVTIPTNAHTVNAQYLPNGKAYEHQTCYIEHLKNIATSLYRTSTSKLSLETKMAGRQNKTGHNKFL